jgi:MFS family permease
MLVAFLAITNTAGRVLGGMMSDRIGRINALFVVLFLQLLNMAGFGFYQSPATLILGVILVGFCFGTLLSVFPSFTADQYGLKNYGANYGILYLAWGLSGVVAPVMADYFYDRHGNFDFAYIICAIMMVVLLFVNCLLKSNLKKVKA